VWSLSNDWLKNLSRLMTAINPTFKNFWKVVLVSPKNNSYKDVLEQYKLLQHGFGHVYAPPSHNTDFFIKNNLNREEFENLFKTSKNFFFFHFNLRLEYSELMNYLIKSEVEGKKNFYIVDNRFQHFFAKSQNVTEKHLAMYKDPQVIATTLLANKQPTIFLSGSRFADHWKNSKFPIIQVLDVETTTRQYINNIGKIPNFRDSNSVAFQPLDTPPSSEFSYFINFFNEKVHVAKGL